MTTIKISAGGLPQTSIDSAWALIGWRGMGGPETWMNASYGLMKERGPDKVVTSASSVGEYNSYTITGEFHGSFT